jgi:hypothetical protein
MAEMRAKASDLIPRERGVMVHATATKITTIDL